MTSARDATRHARDDVAEVLIRYGTGIDRRDWTLFRSCFAEDCDADGIYEFFFCGAPLIITGGSGSPINPQAIK